MYKSKRFHYDYDDVEDGEKSVETMLTDIMEDREFSSLEEIVIGCWGEAWDESCQPLIDGIIENKDKFSNIKSLFFGDMDYEDCEVSWIIQGDYSKLWGALPNLEKLVIKGSTDLELGEIAHDNLKELQIICGGLGKDLIESVQKAKLPNLESLVLYIGSDCYGFDGDISTIKTFLEKSDFPKLTHLGVEDSEIQDEVAECVLDSKYMEQITSLSLANGTMTDKGGECILEKLPNFTNIKKLDLHYHYMSDKMVKKLEEFAKEQSIELDVSEQEEAYNSGDKLYYTAMLTE